MQKLMPARPNAILAIATLLLSLPAMSATALKNQPPYTDARFSVLASEERLEYSDEWRLRTARTMPSNGHAYVLLNMGSQRCAEIAATADDVAYYAFYPTVIHTPSYEGGGTGVFYEALIPRNGGNCTLSPFVLAEWQPQTQGSVFFSSGTSKVEVQIRFDGHFIAPKRPFHVGLTNSFLIKGHCPEYCNLEVPLGNAYSALLKEHHLTPYFNWIRVPPIKDGLLDLDAYADSGGSFRQQVMSHNSAWIGFPRASDQQEPIAYLQALEATVIHENLVGRAWVYVKDEPSNFEALATELSRYRTYAPHVLTMVTTRAQPSLMSGIDIFSPVIHQLIGTDLSSYNKKHLWTYTSCMGSCGPDRRSGPQRIKKVPGPDTKIPDLLIDRPAASIREFFTLSDRVGAEGSLYYHAVEGYVLQQEVDQFDDPWNFGGNGDGLLVYPGIPGQFGLVEHQPLASFRLKLLRREIERQSQINQ